MAVKVRVIKHDHSGWMDCEVLGLIDGWVQVDIVGPTWVQWHAVHYRDRDKLRLMLWAKEQSKNGGHQNGFLGLYRRVS